MDKPDEQVSADQCIDPNEVARQVHAAIERIRAKLSHPGQGDAEKSEKPEFAKGACADE